jgi:hypothetical protein
MATIKAPLEAPVVTPIRESPPPIQMSASTPEQAAPSFIPTDAAASKSTKINTFSAIFAPGGYQSYLAKTWRNKKQN